MIILSVTTYILLIQKYLRDKKLSKLATLLQSEKHLENETAIEILPAKVFNGIIENA